MMSVSLPSHLCCPTCRRDLTAAVDQVCCEAGHTFPIVNGTVDFFGSESVDQGRGLDQHAAQEANGMRKRVDNFVLPWLNEFGAESLLDDGCGIGHVVEHLSQRGVDAYGVDPGSRKQSWVSLEVKSRLFRADGTKLPFKDNSFDAVLSAGVIEHVGEPRPRRQQHPYQRAYVHELIRVLRPGGRALIAAPNGAFPIDFWHPMTRPFELPLRPHLPYEAWMPNGREVAGWVRSAPAKVEIKFLPPTGFLAFDNVARHWYGRAFKPLMLLLFRLIDRFPKLANSIISPWLIVEVRRMV
jgi:SAM-dependent methyltransferase